MFTTEEFVNTLEHLDNRLEQYHLVKREADLLTDETIQRMRARAYELSLTDNSRSLIFSYHLIYASKVSGRLLYKALGLITQGNVFLWRGQYRKAIYRYDKAQRVALVAGSEVEAARSQIGKVGALMHLGEHYKALALALPVSEILLAHKEYVAAARVLINIGNCYSELEQFQKALDAYEKCIALLKQLDPAIAQKELGVAFYNLSLFYCNFGQYQEALHYSLQACELAEQAGLEVDKAVFQKSAAICYNLMGEYNKALRLLHKAGAVFTTSKLMPNLITSEYLICDCYLELGRYEKAVAQSETLLCRLEKLELQQTWQSMWLYHLQGRALMGLEEWAQAEQVLTQAQAIAEQIGATGFKQRTDLRLAELYLTWQQPDKVVQAETLLRLLVQNLDDIRILPTAQLYLARLETGRGEFRAAHSLLQTAVGHFQAHQVQSGLYQAYSQMAEICEAQGNPAQALAYLNQSIEQLELLRNRLAAENRAAFLRPKETIYENAIALSLTLEPPSKAFNLVEQIKSRALVDLIDNRLDVRIRVHSESDRPVVEEIERLRQEHNSLTWQLAHQQGDRPLAQQLARSADFTKTALTTDPRPEETRRRDLVQQKLKCEKQILELTEELQVNNALYAEDVTLATFYRPFDLQILGPEEVLVEYYIARGLLHAFIVSRDGIKAIVQPLCTVRQLNELLSKFRLNLANVEYSLGRYTPKDPQPLSSLTARLIANSQGVLQKLYLALFEPIAPYLSGYRHLRIVPHGPLHYLPFHALFNPTSQHYLLEDFDEISYLPAANVLRFCRERAAQGRGSGSLIFGFSNRKELPGTLEETTRLAAILREWGETVAEVDHAASLERFREEAKTKRIIHLATHGIYREDEPLFSSLLLAGGELTAHEIFNMELEASLFTLSCCNSGLGTIGGGDEVMGLSRACLYAGASSLALSLWQVEDKASSRLMQEFYCNLLEGQGKAAALRQAQLCLLSKPALAHPYYWAPFILIGDTGQL